MKNILAILGLLIAEFAFANSFIPVLVYHRVTTEFTASDTVISPQEFDNHLSRIKALGYRTITISQLEGFVKSGLIPEKTVAITFDDGRKDNLVAAEMLLSHQMTATFYMLSEFAPGYLSKDEVRIIATNFEIGAHSHTHFVEWIDRLDSIDERVMYGEAIMSRAILEEVIGRPVTSFAWPFGYFRPHMLQTMSKLGYTSTVHINSESINQKSSNLMFIQRLNINGNCDSDHIQTMITTGKLTRCANENTTNNYGSYSKSVR